MKEIIKVSSLSKEFGTLKAVNGISFSVSEGEIFGLLGPNGAGKTTTIKMLTTLLKPTSGSAIVAGHDIKSDPNNVRKRIGIVFQDPSLDDDLTGFENLQFHAILYNIPKNRREKRISAIGCPWA
jgi:ABC-2 type transport system ATP-binding protein